MELRERPLIATTTLLKQALQIILLYIIISNCQKQMGERTFFVSKTHSFYALRDMNQQADTQDFEEFSSREESYKQERRKQHHGKTGQLEEYLGEPSLKEYVGLDKDMQEEIDFEGHSLVNRKMRRLRRSNLPKIVYLYQRIMNSYQIEEVEIVNQQEESLHSCTVRSLEPNVNTAVKSISQHSSNSCLTVGQTIAFTKIDMRTFQKIIDEDSRLRILKKLKQKPLKDDIFQSKLQAESLFKQLFQLFCLPGLDFILWPSIVLQPIIGFEDLLTNIITKNIAENRQQLASIFENTLNLYLDNKAKYKDSSPVFHPSKVEQALVQRIQQVTQNNTNPQQFIVRLLGTSFTLRQRELVYQWNSFTSSQRNLLICKTPFQGLKVKLNQVIQSLNQYKRFQHASVQNYFLFQLCKVKIEQSQTLCIPLRIIPSREYYILVRCFASTKSLLEQYIWTNQSQLTVNLTLPSHNHQEQKYYSLFSQNLHYFQVLKLIYSDYFCENASQNMILRSLSLINEREMKDFRQQRCKKCYYLVRNSQNHVSCKSCLEIYHFDCIKKTKDKQQSHLQHTSQRENIDDTWYCLKCAPCTLCKAPITKVQQSLICFSCTSVFHLNCGMIIDQKGKLIKKDLFACQACQKCEICSKSLKNKTFFIEQEKIICSICLSKLYKQFCHKCNEQIPFSQILQCRNPLCNKKLHKTCEDAFIKSCDIFSQEDFKCFSCRASQRRKLMKWVLEELKVFDEYEYFDDPYYQSIDGYSDIIKEPMCFMIMRSKIMQGLYDNNSYQCFCEDLQLIANNAMTFNMPRDQAHFRAKILLIVGTQFLKSFKTLLEFTQCDIMTRPIDKVFIRQRESFYKDIYKNFSRYLLNYGESKPRIEISSHRQPQDRQTIFSSRHILTKTLMNSQFRYRFHVQPQTIGDLFNMPKIIPGIWSNITHQICYYHPKLRQPIVFQCKQCWQTYCCTKVCFKHSFCKICRQYGCSCTSRACQCPQLREREYKAIEKEILPFLQVNQLSKLQYTQFHQYCLKCAKGIRRTCYICEKICCFCYERCDECDACYHVFCENRQRKDKTRSKLYNENLRYQEITQMINYHNKCGKCRVKAHNIDEYKRRLNDATLELNQKVNKITSNYKTLNNIYTQHGIRLSKNEIINIVYQKYQDYETLLHLFDESKKSIQQQPLREQQGMIQGYQEYLEEIKNQIFDIFDKSSAIDVIRQQSSEQERNIQQKSIAFKLLEYNHRISMIVSKSPLYALRSSIFPIQDEFRQTNPNSNIDEIRHSVLSQFIQIHKEKRCLAHSLFHRNETHLPKNTVTSRDIESFSTFMNNIATEYFIDCEEERYILQKLSKQFIKYLRYKSFHRPVGYYSLISSERHELLLPQRKEQNAILPQKKEIFEAYLTAFALKAFQDDKQVLCKGNTYLLSHQENSIIVLKRFDKKSYHIQLTKDRERSRWMLKLNENKYYISTIQDVCNTLKTIGIRLSSFEDLYNFLGFSLADTNYSQSDHFTRWMQQKSFHEMTQHQKKEEVIKIYDKYEWHDNGIFQDRQTKRSYKMKKPNLFFLNKRNTKPEPKDQEQYEQQKKSKPFITLQDLRRQLFPKKIYSCGLFEQQPQVSPFPLNDVYIAPSKIDRLGLYIGRDVPKHTTVIEYIGEIVSESIADLRQLRYKYGCYLFTLGQDENRKIEIIDATHIGNKARFLNHSCDPNCRAKTMNVQGRNRIMIYTVKEVKKDQELTYDYQFKIESNEHLRCNCGSKLCQGRLN